MTKLHDKKVGGLFRGLFAGPSGVGKTIAAGSFPGPMMIYDFDSRVDPLLRFYPKREDIEYKVVTSIDSGRKDGITVVEFLNEFYALQDRCDYETVVLDSLTSLSACLFLYILHINGEFGMKKGQLPKVHLHDYQKETATMLKILETMKGLPCHVIGTSHPITKTEMEEAGELDTMRTTKALTGYGTKTPSFIPNYFNEMYWFYNQTMSQMGQTPKRFICTVANGEIPAKTALPIPPIIELTDQKLYPLLQKYLQEYNVKLETARKETIKDNSTKPNQPAA